MPRKRQIKWPVLLLLMLHDEDIMRHVVRGVRREFRLADPSDEARVALNRKRPRDRILARVEELCSTVDWKDDLDLLQASFHPDEPEDPPAYEQTLERLLDQLPPLRRALCAVLFCYLPENTHIDLIPSLRRRVVHWLTDYAIEGDFMKLTPLPIDFDPEPRTVDFGEDRIITIMVTRFSDPHLAAAKLIARYNEEFVPRTRKRHPTNIERDVWIMTQYQHIRDTKFEDPPRGYLYDELLKRFLASRWAYQIKHHDTKTHEGRQRAKDFLRNAVRRAKTFATKTLPPENSPNRDS